MQPNWLDELRAAIASGRFSAIQAAIWEAAMEAGAPWSGSALLRRMPERSKASFYRALKVLKARKVVVEMPNVKRKLQINPQFRTWKNTAGDAPLFSENSPEMLGFSRRMGDFAKATEKARKPSKRTRVKHAEIEPGPRPGVDKNGDQPGQQHMADPGGTDLNKKEPDIWDKAVAKMKAAHRKP